jgi:hypothetical protein
MDNGLAEGFVGIKTETAWTLKKMLSTSIEKKNWMKENKPEVWNDNPKLQKRYQEELEAYRELEQVLEA